MSIQFQKGEIDPTNLKQVQDAIGEVLALDTEAGPAVKKEVVQAVSLILPSAYTSEQSPADHLRLNADNSFSLQEGGETYHGTFVANGNNLELHIMESNLTTNATLQENKLRDGGGQTWVRDDRPAPAAASEAALRNEDVVKMAQAGFDDAIIIAKIGGSKCQFDTSTDALIQLKKDGVSAAVLKAMVGAGK